MSRIATLSVVLLGLSAPSAALAFTEDVCFASGAAENCYDMGDCTAGDDSTVCTARAVSSAATNLGDGRSMVHFDATYLLGRVVGLDMRTAYLIAAYDQATDLGQYVPLDVNGDPLVSASSCTRKKTDPAACTGTTGDISGLERTNFTTGGYLLHLSMPFNPDGAALVTGIDGAAPNVADEEHEVLLANLNNWVYGSDALCTAGLSNFSNGVCLGESPNPEGTVYGEVPIIGYTDGLPLTLDLGNQAVSTSPTASSQQLLLVMPASHISPAKMGIYLHLLQDRVSHHICGDASVMYEDPASADDYVADYDTDECDQPTHALRHAWETGSTYDDDHAATREGLEATYAELLVYAASKGLDVSTVEDNSVRDAWIEAILANLEIEDGGDRWQAMHDQRAAAGYAYTYSYYGY